jgi:GT2 family glycosyltransferase
MKDLSIIIPVYNNCEFTRSCLEDLSRLDLNAEIIIVDNASEDNTSDVVSEAWVKKSDRGWLVYHRNDKNLGFGAANNIGYAISSGKNVMFLNNDIRVDMMHEDWPKLLMDSDGIMGVQSGRINSKHEPLGEGVFDPEVKGGYLSGWCLCAKREIWDKLVLPRQSGPWDEAFFLYYEDDDLSFRAKKAGIPLLIGAIPVHHYSRVTGKKYNMFYFLKKSKRIFKEKWPEIV